MTEMSGSNSRTISVSEITKSVRRTIVDAYKNSRIILDSRLIALHGNNSKTTNAKETTR